ncbi:MAG: extracellular solute-binding protein [Deltaproteobacteria bacterium]|nr:extracellular solute-binding protein [Deltaproteobacteria bacterium]
MKSNFFRTVTVIVVLWSWLFGSSALAASPSPALVKAKKEAEAKGFIFETSRDEIVAKAKKEGKLRVTASIEPSTARATTAALRKKYPFMDIDVQESKGTEGVQRLLLEIKSGAAKEWDVIHVLADFYGEYTPYLWKVDLLGMAKHGALQIPPAMIDARNGNVLAVSTQMQVTAYNAGLVPADLLPKTWEDLLRPEFKGRKFAVDIRPKDIAGLVPAWGLEKTLNFARKIAAQQPIWVRGSLRTLVPVMTGEIPMIMGPNIASVREIQKKDRTGVLQYVILEPVPVRLGHLQAILATSQHPHAALLWLEWLASPEAQRLNDEHEPFSSSAHVPGGMVEQALRGKKLSVVGWEQQQDIEQWTKKIVEAYGFPRAEK